MFSTVAPLSPVSVLSSLTVPTIRPPEPGEAARLTEKDVVDLPPPRPEAVVVEACLDGGIVRCSPRGRG